MNEIKWEADGVSLNGMIFYLLLILFDKVGVASVAEKIEGSEVEVVWACEEVVHGGTCKEV